MDVLPRSRAAAHKLGKTHASEDSFVQLVELLEQRCPRRQHGLGDLLKHCMSSNEVADARFKRVIGHLANLQAETSENAADAELDVPEFVLQLLARHQQGTHLLRCG
jgi:hypothetical protein